ncbi:hypothetical protein [Jannaschia formosa]|uniref:hypothetical protein n=1 Tax=Jannaschia formosa TaxID=2259592 RepID=UPI000E1C24C1|nr:hypothetical protein [Jannaschia formosa]TFL18361.1 hypothetical protein DR046_09705 [Jannaschia formosa]
MPDIFHLGRDTSPKDGREKVRAAQEGREALTPWLGWVCGPAAWALHQGIGYAMVPWLCDLGTRWPYHLLTVVSTGLCMVGAWAALHALRRSGRVRSERSEGRLRMMALVGLMLCAAALTGIAIEYGASFWLSVCAGIDR